MLMEYGPEVGVVNGTVMTMTGTVMTITRVVIVTMKRTKEGRIRMLVLW